jgi:hypothetical protein
MNKRLLILLIVITLVVVAIPLTLFVLNQQQDIRSNASTQLSDTSGVIPTNTPAPAVSTAPANACTLPTQVINVKMDYPANTGGTTYNFTQASCTWQPVTGATSYSIKITQVESSSVVKTDSVTGSTTTYAFAVTPNNTYKCEISAVNACGTGPAGSDQLLCKTDTIPSSAPSPTVAPSVAPPAVVGAACGSPCTNGTTCAAGLTCVTAANTTRYCAITAYQNACALSPSVGSCCTAPTSAIATAAPTLLIPTALPPTGVTTTTIWLGLGGIAVTIVGGLMLLL